MLVRKNTKAFKTIQELITTCQDRGDRETLVRLYITRAGDSIKDRISIEGIEGGAALFYEMTYQTVLNNLKSSNHQLQLSDEIPGIYFFHSTSNKVWDETPFEFDEAIKKEFASLPDLPAVRKKEAPRKFVLPAAESKRTTPPGRKEQPVKKGNAKVITPVQKRPRQPDFKLKHPIEFTNLDKLLFRQAGVTKQDVLEYYDRVAEDLLPWLEDRPLWTRRQGDGKAVEMTVDGLFKDSSDQMPQWVKTTPGSNKKAASRLLLCNDKEHLLLYAERGCLEFIASQSRTKDLASPDYIVVAVDSPDSGLEKAIGVALAARQILDGLKLQSFIKTDGISGFHIYLPLDAKSDYEASKRTAEYICKIIRLKIPDLVTLKGVDGYVFGKVSLDYTVNERSKGVIAPYSLVATQSPTVATPLSWEEVTEGLSAEKFNHKSIIERLDADVDPFKEPFTKRINAERLLDKLEENYSFLL